MGVLADHQIEQIVTIRPFDPGTRRPGVISSGLTSYGYDLRLGNKYLVFTNVWNGLVDPKSFDKKTFVTVEGDSCVIPPNSFVLAESLEYLEIPRDVLCLVVGKSTYARCGIIVNCTPLEPEWRGVVTIEISNTTPLPAKIYSGEGIAQAIFLKADSVCRASYADKGGRYQNQTGVTLPRIATT